MRLTFWATGSRRFESIARQKNCAVRREVFALEKAKGLADGVLLVIERLVPGDHDVRSIGREDFGEWYSGQQCNLRSDRSGVAAVDGEWPLDGPAVTETLQRGCGDTSEDVLMRVEKDAPSTRAQVATDQRFDDVEVGVAQDVLAFVYDDDVVGGVLDGVEEHFQCEFGEEERHEVGFADVG